MLAHTKCFYSLLPNIFPSYAHSIRIFVVVEFAMSTWLFRLKNKFSPNTNDFYALLRWWYDKVHKSFVIKCIEQTKIILYSNKLKNSNDLMYWIEDSCDCITLFLYICWCCCSAFIQMYNACGASSIVLVIVLKWKTHGLMHDTVTYEVQYFPNRNWFTWKNCLLFVTLRVEPNVS